MQRRHWFISFQSFFLVGTGYREVERDFPHLKSFTCAFLGNFKHQVKINILKWQNDAYFPKLKTLGGEVFPLPLPISASIRTTV